MSVTPLGHVTCNPHDVALLFWEPGAIELVINALLFPGPYWETSLRAMEMDDGADEATVVMVVV